LACQGAIGQGERYGAVYADGFTDIMSVVLSCHRSCIRIRAISIWARAQSVLVDSTHSPVHLSAKQTTESGSRAIRPRAAILPRLLLQYLLSAVESRRRAILGNFLIDTGQ
jgi:hypothetical protein